MNKYQNKYRNASARARWWDYGWNGAYFITICTKNREHYFGKIVDGKMKLSHLGMIADILWHEIPHHAKFVELGDFVVMPNHIHGILILDKPARTKHANRLGFENGWQTRVSTITLSAMMRNTSEFLIISLRILKNGIMINSIRRNEKILFI